MKTSSAKAKGKNMTEQMKKISFDFYSLSTHTEYEVEHLVKILEDAVKEGEDRGLSSVKVSIESRMEPYEDWVGDPEVVVTGLRPKNKSELADDKKEEEIRSLALRKGISFYEASHLKSLMDKGVV